MSLSFSSISKAAATIGNLYPDEARITTDDAVSCFPSVCSSWCISSRVGFVTSTPCKNLGTAKYSTPMQTKSTFVLASGFPGLRINNDP